MNTDFAHYNEEQLRKLGAAQFTPSQRYRLILPCLAPGAP